ncbi:hypothetical protein [Nocardia asiatica]|uniref:hypothetical protein n=1 Tax=Nocardia asiatica TaxID=209252 RepID=UPI002456AC5F|nr:hypothetical protein [Nocardia asiatica]
MDALGGCLSGEEWGAGPAPPVAARPRGLWRRAAARGGGGGGGGGVGGGGGRGGAGGGGGGGAPPPAGGARGGGVGGGGGGPRAREGARLWMGWCGHRCAAVVGLLRSAWGRLDHARFWPASPPSRGFGRWVANSGLAGLVLV